MSFKVTACVYLIVIPFLFAFATLCIESQHYTFKTKHSLSLKDIENIEQLEKQLESKEFLKKLPALLPKSIRNTKSSSLFYTKIGKNLKVV